MKILLIFLAILVLSFANMNVREEILQHAEKFKQLRNHYDNALNGMHNLHEMLAHSHTEVHGKLNEIQKSITRRDACANAITALIAQTTAQCVSYGATYLNTSASISIRTTAAGNFCSQCEASLVAAIKSVLTSCNSTQISQAGRKTLLGIGLYANFMCSNDSNGNQCGVVFLNINSALLAKSFDQLQQSDLNTLCSTCVSRALRFLIQSGTIYSIPAYNAYLGLSAVCVQVNGKYCILTLQPLENQITTIAGKYLQGQQPTASDFKGLLNIVCYPCYRIIITRITILGFSSQISVTVSFSVFGALCRKDQNGNFCFVKLYNSFQTIINSIANSANSSSASVPCLSSNLLPNCDSGCQNFLSNLINDGGCCWSLFSDYVSQGSSVAATAFYNFVSNCTAGVIKTLPAPCPFYANATLTVIYNNLDINWINNNMATFQIYFAADLPFSFGPINYGSITVTTSGGTKRGSSTVTTVTVPANVPGTASGALTGASIACQSVCANVNPNDPTQDVTVTTQASQVTTQSASSSLSVSLALLFVLVIAQFFF